MLGATRPYGSKLLFPTDVKIKAMQLQRKPGQANNRNFWSDWFWDDWIKRQIDLAQEIGANTVRVPGTVAAVSALTITRAVFHARIAQLLEYVESKNMYAYWTSHMPFGGDDANADNTAMVNEIKAMMTLVGQSGRVIGNDCSNESILNRGAAVGLANQQVFYEAIKEVAPDLQLGSSQSTESIGSFTDPDHLAFEPYIDFWDIHPYYPTTHAVPADLDGLRAVSSKPIFVGECGAKDSAGAAFQTARITALGVLAAMPDCFGSVAFTTVDNIASPADFGFYSADGLFTPRQHLIDAYQSWPSNV